MGGSGYEALAAFQVKYWWWLIFSTLGVAGCLIQVKLGKFWAQGALKIMLAINAAVIGWLFFSGVVAPGMAALRPVFGLNSPWISQSITFIYLLIALLWLFDAFLSRTSLVLPQRPLSRIQIQAGCALALLFPAYELVGLQILPRAEAFGAGPAPFVLFTIVLLAGSRPDTWVGRLLLILTAVLSLDAGLLDAIYGGHWHHLLVLMVVVVAVIYGLKRRRMVALNASR